MHVFTPERQGLFSYSTLNLQYSYTTLCMQSFRLVLKWGIWYGDELVLSSSMYYVHVKATVTSILFLMSNREQNHTSFTALIVQAQNIALIA